MDPSLILSITALTSVISGLLFVLQKYIKSSSCLGNTIVFRTPNTPSTPTPTPPIKPDVEMRIMDV
jgi:hypothetical protein